MGATTTTTTTRTILSEDLENPENFIHNSNGDFELLPLPSARSKHSTFGNHGHGHARSSNDFIESVEISEHNTLTPGHMTLRDVRDRRPSTHSYGDNPPQIFQNEQHVDSTVAAGGGSFPPLAPTTSIAPSIHPHASQVRLKLISCFLCTFVAGLNDGSFGALVPYVIEEYHISESQIAFIYMTSFFGWALGALFMPITMRYCGGVRGTILVGAICQVLSNLFRFWIPPYPLFAVGFFLATLGQAFQDAQANTFISTLQQKHLWLGFLHAMWSLGSLVAPLMATAIASSEAAQRGNLKWSWAVYYVIPLGVGVVNTALVLVAFYRGPNIVLNTSEDTQASGPEQQPSKKSNIGTHMKEELWEAVRLKIFWLICLFFFFHLAAAMTIGGWIVVYLTSQRGMPLSRAGYVPTGYWGGFLLGRLLLPQPTNSLLGGEHYMLLVYSACLLALQLISWFVPSAIATATVLSMMGFFFGPFFAAGVKVASDVLPRKVKTSALGLVFVAAQVGGSVLPAVMGIVASQVGVGVLQPLAVALIVAMGVSWWAVPKVDRRGGWRE